MANFSGAYKNVIHEFPLGAVEKKIGKRMNESLFGTLIDWKSVACLLAWSWVNILYM